MSSKTTALYLLLLALAGGVQAQSRTVVLDGGTPYTIESRTAAVVDGGATPKYQWYRNGKPISGATLAGYSVPAAEAYGINVEFKRAAYVDGCNELLYSNSVIITWRNLVVNGLWWADVNVDDFQTFAARPDMYTKLYQWSRSKAWAATGVVSGWETSITDPAWTINPCPTGWRLPMLSEFQMLHDEGSTWVYANEKGNAIAGRFYGPNHASCTLPSSMAGCIFLPASGYRHNSDGTLTNQSTSGYCWSSTSSSSSDGRYHSFNIGNSQPTRIGLKAQAFNIRCVQ